MRLTIILISFLLSGCVLKAQQVTELNQKVHPSLLNIRWKAQWIAHPKESLLDYGVFHYRKTFNLPAKPKEFIINISADNRYRLFVNGTEVCYGPARSDPEHWSFETIDIAPFLKQGENLIASEVWNFGELRPWAQFSIKTAFIIQGNSMTEDIVNTDLSWKVIEDEAYSPAPAGSTHRR